MLVPTAVAALVIAVYLAKTTRAIVVERFAVLLMFVGIWMLVIAAGGHVAPPGDMYVYGGAPCSVGGIGKEKGTMVIIVDGRRLTVNKNKIIKYA